MLNVILFIVILLSYSCGDIGANNDVLDIKKYDIKPIDISWKENGQGGGDDFCDICDSVIESKHDILDGFLACEDGEQCKSGLCVTSPEGIKVCAPLCGGGKCPEYWDCVPIPNPDGDVVFVCLPGMENLCRPCQKDEECKTQGNIFVNKCVSFGSMGSFCGRDCSIDSLCPSGYACKDVLTTKQCLPLSQECECSPKAITDGAKTLCYTENQFGKCLGEKRCTDNGLTPCNAKVPEPEKCDLQDNDCDGETDEESNLPDCEKLFGDILCKAPVKCENGLPVCKVEPPSSEVCDSIDNDCDGVTDPPGTPNCKNYYQDKDKDGWGFGIPQCLCKPTLEYSTEFPGDCNDDDPFVKPGGIEICDQKDNDCDGETDEPGTTGCQHFYIDADGDGYGSDQGSKCLCNPSGIYQADKPGDCADNDPSVNPGAKEVCNSKDDNCDNLIDPEGTEGCKIYYFDNDGDGYGLQEKQKCLCSPQGKYSATVSGDCNDDNPNLIIGGVEQCDGIDNDCDGFIDEEGAQGCKIYYLDKDGDGFGGFSDSKCLCNPLSPYTSLFSSDCNDSDPMIFPGKVEVCNGKDDNCNGLTDEEGANGCIVLYFDGDGDGYGVETLSKCLCMPGPIYSASKSGDCDDKDGSVFPSAPEKCDGKDNNCNGAIDEVENILGCVTYYLDKDGDGWGAMNNTKCLCKPSPGYVDDGGDCDDDDPKVHPQAYEPCDNIDNDCDGETDEDEGTTWCNKYYWDEDGDGVGDQMKYKCLCKPSGKYTAKEAGDCDDTDANIRPGLEEKCDFLDNNCNGQADETFVKESFKDPENGLEVIQDFSNKWPGQVISKCKAGISCIGVQSGRLLPKADEDWMRVFKAEAPDGQLPGTDIKAQVFFKGASDSKKSFTICICFSSSNLCDQSALVCKTSYEGVEVSLEVINKDEFQKNDDSWLDIQIKPKDSSNDFSCYPYNLTWQIWEK